MSEVKAKRWTISVSEAKKILEPIDLEKADQIQKRTIAYLEKFSKTTPEKAEKMRKHLMKECGLTEEEATELTNIQPKTHAELRVFTAGWRKLLPTQDLEKILKIIKENA